MGQHNGGVEGEVAEEPGRVERCLLQAGKA
jgi:hypothetical protein